MSGTDRISSFMRHLTARCNSRRCPSWHRSTKLSVAFAIGLGMLVLGEPLSWRVALGGGLVAAGALIIAFG